MTTNTDTDPIICRTLRELDALVAERVMRLEDDYIARGYPKGCLNRNPGVIPHYTSWAGLGEVVAKVESERYPWDLRLIPFYGSLVAIHTAIIYDQHCSVIAATEHELAPVAFNLAALAAFGCRVQLELN